MIDPKIQPRSLSTLAWIRKGKLIRKWIKRKCVISTSRLTVYPGSYHRRKSRASQYFVLDRLDANTNPCVIELQRASVEEVRLKDKPFCLKLIVDDGRGGALFLALNNDEEYSRWLKRLRKVRMNQHARPSHDMIVRCVQTTNKLPDIADYSSSHLELIPKNLFINQKLAVLNLRHNNLRMRPADEPVFTVGMCTERSPFLIVVLPLRKRTEGHLQSFIVNALMSRRFRNSLFEAVLVLQTNIIVDVRY